MDDLNKYLAIISQITRPGIKQFSLWLSNETDFLTAPASTRFHGSVQGGLLAHSLAVYNNMLQYSGKYNIETIRIVSLFHDICKANFYKETTRNVKNDETGRWEKVPYYTVEEQFPYGSHGGKSVYLLLTHGLQITDEEAVAINCHMGGWDFTNYHNPSPAFEKYPLALYLHIADMLATYIDKQ